jgi:hypothetical protein
MMCPFDRSARSKGPFGFHSSGSKELVHWKECSQVTFQAEHLSFRHANIPFNSEAVNVSERQE